MVNEKQILKFGLELANTYQDYPFPNDKESTVLKHTKTGKWFALFMKVHHQIYVNVKTEPCYSELLRKQYSYIIAAYHMNKEHWNTIIIQEETEEKLVKELIIQSYELTKQ